MIRSRTVNAVKGCSAARPAPRFCRPSLHQSIRTSRAYSNLRILFCGADEFSIPSLRAVDELRREPQGRIASIDVVCRPDKRVGRGRKEVRQVPIKAVAQDLGLPLHQIDTFTGWTPPQPFDLVIAVSFGLLVPSRILTAARYGGLNVHPSLLPDLRGPAPLHHALLAGRSHTGVTLQTMHPTQFDRGAILAQAPSPALEIPAQCTVGQLHDLLAPIGAKLLKDGVDTGLFENPQNIPSACDVPPHLQVHAPKITKDMHEVQWETWTANDVLLRDRVLSSLWDTTTFARCSLDDHAQAKRIVFEGPWRDLGKAVSSRTVSRSGQPTIIESDTGPQFAISTVDGRFVSPSHATLDGGARRAGIPTLVKRLSRRMCLPKS